jgi:hypothetical protein
LFGAVVGVHSQAAHRAVAEPGLEGGEQQARVGRPAAVTVKEIGTGRGQG